MTYSPDWIKAQVARGRQLQYLYFWGHRKSPLGEITATCLSQWYASGFSYEGQYYPTAEHWMMAEKARLFGDQKVLDRIFRNNDPLVAKKLGRQVKHFSEQVWRDNMVRIVTEGNYHKFGQSEKLQSWLLSTGQRVLVEASPYDVIWGIGMVREEAETVSPLEWRGENWLGWCLMEVRDRLRTGE